MPTAVTPTGRLSLRRLLILLLVFGVVASISVACVLANDRADRAPTDDRLDVRACDHWWEVLRNTGRGRTEWTWISANQPPPPPGWIPPPCPENFPMMGWSPRPPEWDPAIAAPTRSRAPHWTGPEYWSNRFEFLFPPDHDPTFSVVDTVAGWPARCLIWSEYVRTGAPAPPGKWPGVVGDWYPARIVWKGLLIDVIAYALGAILVLSIGVATMRTVQTMWRIACDYFFPVGRCRKCRYPLLGLTPNPTTNLLTCPECGTPSPFPRAPA